MRPILDRMDYALTQLLEGYGVTGVVPQHTAAGECTECPAVLAGSQLCCFDSWPAQLASTTHTHTRVVHGFLPVLCLHVTLAYVITYVLITTESCCVPVAPQQQRQPTMRCRYLGTPPTKTG